MAKKDEKELKGNIEPDAPVDNSKAQVSEPEEKGKSTEEQLQAKVDELNDKYLRLYSDFDNYRKRTAKERIELIKTAGEDIFKSFLPVIDDFERALKSMNETSDLATINEGINLIYQKFKTTLTQKGLEEMTSKGADFNTDLHEAITNVPAPSEDMKGKVVDELEKGYLLNGKVIRYAKVVVGS